jgi:DNA-binding LytR/AlgR family response regulator
LAVSIEPAPGLTEMMNRILSSIKASEKPDFLQWIRTQQQNNIHLIPVEEIDYFKAEDKYTLVMTGAGESLIKKSIKELAQELDPAQFWQVHRATIVNVSKIEKVSRSLTGRGVLKLKERPELLTVSRPYLHLFKQM